MMANADRLKSIRLFALESRLFIALIQTFFNYLIPDHDAKVFNPPDIHETNSVDHAVTFLLGGFRRWDAIYFLHVAEYGYTYENTLAFFPLFPLLTRMAANTILLPLQFVMNFSNCLLVAAFFLNLVLFVLSSDVLYRLSVRVIGSNAVAYRAAQFYCVNPASVFFSAPYSETIFALLTFCGMLYLENGCSVWSALLFGASSLARSNGLVNCAFIWYKFTRDFQKKVIFCVKMLWPNLFSIFLHLVLNFLIFISKALLATLLSWSPFVMYQYFAYKVFCNPLASYRDIPTHVLNYGNNQKYKMPHTGLSEWCHQSVPMSYSYVQNVHWNVGFLNYFELKQIPNFLLAMPMISLCAFAVIYYATWNPIYVLSLGLWNPARGAVKKTDDVSLTAVQTFGIRQESCLVYVVHLAVLAIFGGLFMHIQVLTRFIASSSPTIYWFIASVAFPEKEVQSNARPSQDTSSMNENNGTVDYASTKDQGDNDLSWNDSSWFSHIVLVYFHMYIFVGVAAFSNFLPWT